MKKQTIGKILIKTLILIWIVMSCLIVIFMIVNVISFVIESKSSEKMGYVEVNCYDRYGNEMMNQNCEETVYCGVISKWLDQNKCNNVYEISMKDRNLNKYPIFLGEKEVK